MMGLIFNLGNINLIGFSFFLLIGLLFGIFSLIAVIWAIVDCLNSKKETTEKLIWILIILILNVIGVILYLVFKDSEFEKELSSSVKKEDKVLARSESNKILFGVCGGFGKYFNIDPTLIRLFLVLLFFLRGSGLLIYIIFGIVMPSEDSIDYKSNKKDEKKVKSKFDSSKSKKENKKEVDDKKKETKGKKKQKKKYNAFLLLILFLLFLLVISSIAVLVGLFSYTSFTEETSSDMINVRQVISEKYNQIISENDLNYLDHSKSTATKFIREHYDYRSNNGHNLTYLGIDDYDQECFSRNCYKLIYEFDSDLGTYKINIYVDDLSIVQSEFELN